MTTWAKAHPSDIYCINCGLTWDMHIAVKGPGEHGLGEPSRCPSLPRLYTVTKCSQCGHDIESLRATGCPESRGGCGRRPIPGTKHPEHVRGLADLRRDGQIAK